MLGNKKGILKSMPFLLYRKILELSLLLQDDIVCATFNDGSG